MNALEPVTDAEEDRYRTEFDHAVRSAAYGGSSLHLPDLEADEPKPKCARQSRARWREVGWECFPKGVESICKLCHRDYKQE